MKLIGKVLSIIIGFSLIGASLFGVRQALNSSLFLVENIEVQVGKDRPPVDQGYLVELIAVPLGANLFSVDLAGIKNRLFHEDWIEDVHVSKNFPERSVQVRIEFRQPIALFREPSGELRYMDANGAVFGAYSLHRGEDLPLISGLREFGKQAPRRQSRDLDLDFQRMGRWVTRWQESSLARLVELSEIEISSNNGLRAIISYPMRDKRNKSRAVIEFGEEFDSFPRSKIQNIEKTIHYLQSQSIAVRRIWANQSKKVVVKIAHDS